MENQDIFELSPEFEQEVYDFVMEMLKNYDDKTEMVTYVTGQIVAAIKKIEEETYDPTHVTIETYLDNIE